MHHESAPRRRVPLLTALVLVFAAAWLAAPVRVGEVAYVPVAKPFCLVDPDIPDEAYAVEEFVRTHNMSPPPGLKGGRPYQDVGHALPALLRPYKEYDVFPADPERGRPAPRVVLSDRLPYASWYSSDHYASFLLMFPVSCLPNVGSLGPPDPFGPWTRGGS